MTLAAFDAERDIDLDYEAPAEGPIAVTAAKRAEEWRPLYGLPSSREEFAFGQLVMASVLLENAQAQEIALRDSVAGRTDASFDRERRRQAEAAGKKLRRNPSFYLAELESTRHGAMWLLARWKGLGAVFTSQKGGWTPQQKALALDLLGVDPVFRTGDPLAAEGPPAELVARKVAELEDLIASDLAQVDQLDRDLYRRGLDLETSAAMRAIRRDQATHLRRYQAAAKLLKPARAAVKSQTLAQPVAPPPPPKPAPPPPTPAPQPIPAHISRAAEIALAPARPPVSFFAPITVGGARNQERPPVFTGM